METVASKVPPELAQRIEAYQEEHGLNKSQAVRQLVEDGFRADRLEDDLEERRQYAERSISFTKPAVVSLIGWFLITVDWITLTGGYPLGWVGLSLIIATFAYSAVTGPE